MEALHLNDAIEDILIALSKQCHVIRLLRFAGGCQHMFLYCVIGRRKANWSPGLGGQT